LDHVAMPAFAGVLSVTLATLARGHFTDNIWGQAILANSIVVTVYVGTLLAFSRYLHPNPFEMLALAKDTVMAKYMEWRT